MADKCPLAELGVGIGQSLSDEQIPEVCVRNCVQGEVMKRFNDSIDPIGQLSASPIHVTSVSRLVFGLRSVEHEYIISQDKWQKTTSHFLCSAVRKALLHLK